MTIPNNWLPEQLEPKRIIVQDGAGNYHAFPKLTTAERTSLSAVNGFVVYDSSLNKLYRYENGAWVDFDASVPDASTIVKGIAELATQTEVNTGVDTTRIVTPNGLANYSGFQGSAPSGYNFSSLALVRNATVYADENLGIINSGTGKYVFGINHNLSNPNLVRSLKLNVMAQVGGSSVNAYIRDGVCCSFSPSARAIVIIHSLNMPIVYASSASPIVYNSYGPACRAVINAKITSIIWSGSYWAVTLTYNPGWIGVWTNGSFGSSIATAMPECIIDLIHS